MLATLGTHVDSCLRKPKILRLEIEFCAISSDREPSMILKLVSNATDGDVAHASSKRSFENLLALDFYHS